MNYSFRQSLDLNFESPAFSAGDSALRWSDGEKQTSQSIDWLFSPLHERLFLAACHAIQVPAGAKLHAMFALPFGWADNISERFGAHYARKWSIANKTSSVSFQCVPHVKQQGLMALLNNAYQYETRTLDRDILASAVVLDIGGLTLDYVTVIDGRHGNACGSIPDIGIKSVYAALQREMSERHGIVMSDTDAMRAVETRKYYHDGWFSWVDGFVSTALQELAEINHQKILNRIPNFASFPTRILTGGAGAAVFPYLSKMFSGLSLSKQPLFDNAIGAALAGEKYRGQCVVGFDIGLQNVKACKIVGDTLHGVAFPSVVGNRIYGGGKVKL